METVIYNNTEYPLRTIYHNDFGEVTLGTTDLSEKLISEDGCFFSDEACDIDETIFYFVEPHQIKLGDWGLLELITTEVK